MDFNKVTLDFAGESSNVAVLRFNHPEVLNAIGADMLEGLDAALREVQDPNNGARCLLITGEGRGFCAGANLADRKRGQGAGASLRNAYPPSVAYPARSGNAVVTAVNGAAAGVGMSLAILGDIVCASKHAFFLQAFARIGLVPDGGATFMLPRLVGWGRAMELSLLAERLPAEKAERWGLVNRVFDDNAALLDGALALAERLANGPRSLALMRRLYWATWHNAYEQQLDLEARMQAEAARTQDHAEGVKAFFDKRDPQFAGE